jgi:hypothetical protein
MSYSSFQTKQKETFQAFPMGFAFSEEQLKRVCENLGASKEELCSVHGGCIIRKADKREYVQMLKKLDDEKTAFLSDIENFKEAVRYELANHEYQITMDRTDTVESLGMDWETMSIEHKEAFKSVARAFMDECIENDWF